MWKGIRYAAIFMMSVALLSQILAYVSSVHMKVLCSIDVICLAYFAFQAED